MTICKQSISLPRRAARILMALTAAVTLTWGAVGAGQAATRTDIKQIVVEEALATTVPPSLALAVAKVESDFQAGAISPKGARGVMQIMPATARGEFGVGADELWNARLNIQLGIDFLAQLIRRYDGRWDLALSHYNSGRIKRSGGRAEPLRATRKYVETVLRWQRRYAAQANVWRVKPPAPTGWRPAATRITRLARPLARRKAMVRVAPERTTPAAAHARFRGLDDFAAPIEERRQRMRLLLDDFADRDPRTKG